ncbi:hypothetical protein FQN52_003057 [Onygenales sp. PD_12]|nr:hypothetical protein FQN52_003057 [Onygenales sp. PD_12]
MTGDNRKRGSDKSETEYQEPKVFSQYQSPSLVAILMRPCTFQRARANGAAMDAPEESYTLSDGLKKYFNDPQWADLTIKTGDRDFEVHKLVVCSQSEYFARRFTGSTGLTGLFGNPTDTNVITSDEDTSTIEAMLRFMYGIDYDGQGSTSGVGRDYNSDREGDSEDDDESSDDGNGAEMGDYDSPPLFHVKVYRIAEKYGVPELMKCAQKKFAHATSAYWNTDQFAYAVVKTYINPRPTEQEFRDILAKTAAKHLDVLIQKARFLDVMKDCGEFSTDVMQFGTRKFWLMKGYKCTSCAYVWGSQQDVKVGKARTCPKCATRSRVWKRRALKA